MSEATGTNKVVRADRDWLRWGAAGLIAALIADVLFNINVDKGENGGTRPMIVVAIILVVLAAVLYLAVLYYDL